MEKIVGIRKMQQNSIPSDNEVKVIREKEIFDYKLWQAEAFYKEKVRILESERNYYKRKTVLLRVNTDATYDPRILTNLHMFTNIETFMNIVKGGNCEVLTNA